MELKNYLSSRRSFLLNQIREKTTTLEERKGQVSILEIEIQQLRGALVEILNMINSTEKTTESVIEEDISDDDTSISE